MRTNLKKSRSQGIKKMGGDGVVETSADVATMEIRAMVIMELVGDRVVQDLHTMGRPSSLQRQTLRL